MKFIFLPFILVPLMLFSQDACKNDKASISILIQPGFAYSENDFQKINTNCIGVGGLFRFYLPKKITVGITGGKSKARYASKNSDKSYVDLLNISPFAGYTNIKNKMRYTLAYGPGYGFIKNYHQNDIKSTNPADTFTNEHNTFTNTLLASVDMYLNKRMVFTFQLTHIYTRLNKKTYHNPSLNMGVLFNF